MSQLGRADASASRSPLRRSRFAAKAVSAVAACALAMGLPAMAFADETDAELDASEIYTLEEGELADVPEMAAPYDALAEEAELLAAPPSQLDYEEKTTNINGVTYRYYIGDTAAQAGPGAYVVNTSSAATVVLPQKIDGQDVVYAKTYGDEGLKEGSEAVPFALDASKATTLKYLDVSGPITSLNVSTNAGLEYLSVSVWQSGAEENRLTTLDVSKCAALESLHCSGAKLTSLDVSGNPKLTNLYVSSGRLTSLDTTKNPELMSLSCPNNRLAALDTSKNAKLQHLEVGRNGLSALDVSANTELISLSCSNNYLTKLDVSKNPELVSLYCSNNDLSALDVSKNAELKHLYCAGNRIADTKALTDRFGTDKNIVIPQKKMTPFFRYAGATALDTMSLVAAEMNYRDTVIVATMGGYWDALTASSLAGLYDCPIILTDSSTLSWQAEQSILKLGASKVYIAGGTAAVSDGVKKAIENLDGIESVDRLAGDIAINTALKIYEEGKGSWGTTAVVATSGTFQDALSVSPYAYANEAPIFLANASTLTLDDQVLKAIKDGGFNRVVIVGGTAAISDKVEKQLDGIECKRLAGPTAYETSGAIASWCQTQGMGAAYVGVATGASYYDALAGAALCGMNNSALVLVDDGYRSNIDGFIASNKAGIRNVNIFGGTAAVSDATSQAIAAALK